MVSNLDRIQDALDPHKTRPPRLEGDDLFTWAKRVTLTDLAIEQKQVMAVNFLAKYGLEAGDYLLSDDGYIVSRQEFEAAQRIQHFPASPSQGHRHPDTESEAEDPHTEA